MQKLVIYDNFTRGKNENIEDLLKDERCHLYENGGDIRDIDLLDDAMKGVDYVFHLAAMWLLHCKDYPRTAFKVNIEGTFNVLEACVKNNVKKLVYSSSASVYGDAVEVPMTESHPYNNKNFYGATKISGRCALHLTTATDFAGNRIALYERLWSGTGSNRSLSTGVVPIMLNKIDANESPVINGDGSQAYDFIYVEDVAKCNIAAIKSDIPFGFYNVGTGVQTSIREL